MWHWAKRSSSEMIFSACPAPILDHKTIVLGHGSGGRLTHQLIQQMILPAFHNPALQAQHDGAIVPIEGSRIAFSTDSYIVHPIFFPGGNIGDLAVNVAEASERYIIYPPVKALVDLPRMAELAQTMLRGALDAFIAQSVAGAQTVLEQDDQLDALKNQVFRELLTYMLGDTKTIEPSIDLILISRHLERIGDHATNIAENLYYAVKGESLPDSRPKGDMSAYAVIRPRE